MYRYILYSDIGISSTLVTCNCRKNRVPNFFKIVWVSSVPKKNAWDNQEKRRSYHKLEKRPHENCQAIPPWKGLGENSNPERQILNRWLAADKKLSCSLSYKNVHSCSFWMPKDPQKPSLNFKTFYASTIKYVWKVKLGYQGSLGIHNQHNLSEYILGESNVL